MQHKALLSAIEDYEDIQEIKSYLDNPEESFPLEVVLALSEGENAIKVYREYRGISQTELAKKVNVSKQYISQLENGDRAGTTKVLKSIAKVLDVNIEDICN